MFHVLKLAHFAGLVTFLGSILTFIIISAVIDGASLEDIALGRKIISTGTNTLTLPGMWLLAITGIWMAYVRYGMKSTFFQIKLVIIILIVANAILFVVPAVNTASEIATYSLAQRELLTGYRTAYLQESLSGAVNVLLTVTAAVIGVWKIGAPLQLN